jgi:hypothetical protein
MLLSRHRSSLHLRLDGPVRTLGHVLLLMLLRLPNSAANALEKAGYAERTILVQI